MQLQKATAAAAAAAAAYSLINDDSFIKWNTETVCKELNPDTYKVRRSELSLKVTLLHDEFSATKKPMIDDFLSDYFAHLSLQHFPPVTNFTKANVVTDYTPTGGHAIRSIPSNLLSLQSALTQNAAINAPQVMLNHIVKRSFECYGFLVAFIERVLEEF